MTDTFYIAYDNSPPRTWYMLIIKDTHFCISCGMDLDKILKSLKKCVKRTRSKERLLREIRGLNCGNTVSPATFEQREEWYKLHGKDYEDLVHSTVLEALHEAKEEDRENSPLRKTTKRLQKVGLISPVSKVYAEGLEKTTTTIVDSSPKILRKPRVFNRK